MTFIKKSVPKPEGPGAGSGTPKGGDVTLIYTEDILHFPDRDSTGVVLGGNIVLKPDAVMYTIYMTPSSQKGMFEIEGDEDLEGFKPSFEGMVPGDTRIMSRFVQYTTGRGVILIYGADCGKQSGRVMGSPCNPMKLRGSFEDGKEASKFDVKFEQVIKSKMVPAFYDGELMFASNYEAPASAIDFTKANGFVYQLQSLGVTEAITAASIDLDHNTYVTLIGGGGTDPSTLSSGTQGAVTVLLVDDINWVGLAKSVINFQVFNAGATIYLYERSRS